MMPRLEYWYYKFTSKRFTCNDYILSRIYFKVENSEADKSLSYYVFNRASAILCNKDREISRLFAEYRDKLVVIDGENKKEHEYLIPKTKVDRYDDNINIWLIESQLSHATITIVLIYLGCGFFLVQYPVPLQRLTSLHTDLYAAFPILLDTLRR